MESIMVVSEALQVRRYQSRRVEALSLLFQRYNYCTVYVERFTGSVLPALDK
jgi:hypothetical protein